jgi:hypothetical protein
VSRRWLAVPVVAVLSCTASCSSNTPGDLTAAGERVLAPQVQRIRDVAATGTYAQLQAAVRRLKELVATEEHKGQVSPSRATAIDDAADVLLVHAAPTTAPTTAPPTTQAPTPSSTPTVTQSPTPSESSSPPASASQSPTPGVTVSVP